MSGDGLTTDFTVVEQGYDPSQVDEYLATGMLHLREQLDTANHRIEELVSEISLSREAEEGLRMLLVLAKRARDEMIENAKTTADDLLSEARREAFVLMTEARSDADGSMSESKAIVAAARDEALNVVNDVEAETARLIAERDGVLAKLREEYEAESTNLIDRINTLRSIADDLDAKNSGAPTPPAATKVSTDSDEQSGAAVASQAEDVPNHDDGAAPSADKIRESFSGRRSAKLPRIGEEAGRSALAAATAMRAHLTHEPDDSEKSGEDDLAARTA